MKGKKYNFVFTLVTLVVFLVVGLYFRHWLNFKPLASGDWGYGFESYLETLLQPPSTWLTVGLGHSNVATRWPYPLELIAGMVAKITNFHFEVIEKLVIFWPMLLIIYFSCYFFKKKLSQDNIFLLLFLIFFLTNTYFLTLASGGQILWALGLAFFPAVFASFHQAMVENTWPKRILAGVFLVILTVFDPRVTYLALITIFLYYLFLLIVSPSQRRNLLINYSKIFLAVLPIFLGIMAYWWLPLVLTRDLGLPAGFGSPAQTKELSFATMANTITSFHPFWPENIFGKIHPTPFYFFLVPIFAFSTLLLRPKDKLVIFFSALALVGVFFAKGAQEPLGEIYLFLNRFFPGFSFFRDPTKFYVLIVFSYSVLLAIFAQEIFQRIKKDYLRHFFLFIFLGFLVFLSKEAVLGQLNGTFQPKEIPQEYKSFAQTLFQDQQFYRTFWLPSKYIFAYGDNNHPEVTAWDLTQRPPIASFVSHFYHTFSYLDSPATEQFFDVLAIRYLFVLDVSEQKFQNEKDRQGTQKSQTQLTQSLSKKDWLKPVKFFNNAQGFENKNFSDHFWLVEKTATLAGSDKVYETLSTFPNFKLKNFAILNSQDSQNADLAIIEDPKGELKLNQPAIFIYNLNSNQKNSTKFFIPQKDSYQIFTRTAKGQLPKFRQEEVPYGQIQTYSWQQLPTRQLSGKTEIELKDKNSDRVMLIPESLKDIFSLAQAKKIEYQPISPTRYKIRIPKSEAGKILAFSESFHPKWVAEIAGQKIGSLPLYGLINGFPISTNFEGELTIEFLPQKTIPWALGISIISLIIVISSFVVTKRKKP